MELLSPAGSPESFKAAVESGANAVYLGLPWFNARKPALNFTPATLKSALEEAHEKGVKVYVTLNTDIKVSEIEDAAKVLKLLDDLKVDAVIIKDLGLFYIARKFFPNLELHFSTQLGIANSYAAEASKQIGAKRVIPARELNSREIELLNNGKNIPEIEVFVQGSMCFSFSGKCLLSSWVGGKSANRGVCQAPCRLKYSSDNREFPFFSMKDLNLASNLDKLKKAQVSSLKIEGRLKNPGWVSSITSIYNSALNGVIDEEKTKEELQKYSGREMGEGFFSGTTDLTAQHMAKFGSFLGEVVDLVSENGIEYAILNFNKKSPETSMRFVSDEDEFLTIIHPDNCLIVPDGDKGIIKTEGRIKKNSLVYEVIPSKNSSNSIGKMRYDLELEVVGNSIEISVVTDTDIYKSVDPYKNIKKEKRAVFPDAVYDKLIDKVVDGWRLNKLYCEDIPLSKTQVNNIVKIVSYTLAVTIKESNPLNSIELEMDIQNFIKTLPNGETTPEKEFVRVSMDNLGGYTEKNIIVDEIVYNEKKLDAVIELGKKQEVVISLFPICFEKDMEEYRRVITYLEARNKFLYEINDLGHYNLLKNYLGIPPERFIGGQGLSCYNHLSIKFMKDELGINSVSIPMEMDSRGVVSLVESNNSYCELNFTTLAEVPVMYSRVNSEEFYEGAQFIDRIGTLFYVHKFRDLNIFIADEYFSSKGCKDLDGLKFSRVISDRKCIEYPKSETRKFNLERRLY